MNSSTERGGLYDTHADLIRRRWPQLWERLEAAPELAGVTVAGGGPQATLYVDGIHLSSCYDREGESRLQARLIPEGAKTAWVYGMGMGDLVRELLRRDAIEELNVVVLNRAVFRELLSRFDQQDWLRDPRVQLRWPGEIRQLMAPFAAAPGCLRLADGEGARLRDQVVLELSTPYINSRFQDNEAYVAQVRDNIPLLARDGDAAALFGRCEGQTILAVAAGPSLDQRFAELRERQGRAFIVAVDAALKPLLANGVRPDVVVTADPKREPILAFFDVDRHLVEDIPLVYLPVVHRDALESWPGPRYGAYSESPIYAEAAGRVPRARLFAAGSVLHTVVDLAVHMGAATVELFGADFAYPSGMSHVEGAVFTRPVPVDNAAVWVMNGRGEKVATDLNLRGYLRDLETFVARHPEVRFLNTGQEGAAIEGAPYRGDWEAPSE